MLGDDPRAGYAVSLLFWPYLFTSLITWWDRGSFWAPKFSFFEILFACVMYVLGGRLWDLHHKANDQADGMAELKSTLEGTLAKVQQLGERLSEVGRQIDTAKRVSLDITEQLAAVEHKIDAIECR